MKTYADNNGKERPARKQGKSRDGYDAAFRGFVNVSLDAEQKETFDVWRLSDAPWERLELSCADGVAFGLKRNPAGDGYIASATQRRESSPDAGLVVTARASDPIKALGRLLFCLTVLSHGENWEGVQPMADPDRW